MMHEHGVGGGLATGGGGAYMVMMLAGLEHLSLEFLAMVMYLILHLGAHLIGFTWMDHKQQYQASTKLAAARTSSVFK